MRGSDRLRWVHGAGADIGGIGLIIAVEDLKLKRFLGTLAVGLEEQGRPGGVRRVSNQPGRVVCLGVHAGLPDGAVFCAQGDRANLDPGRKSFECNRCVFLTVWTNARSQPGSIVARLAQPLGAQAGLRHAQIGVGPSTFEDDLAGLAVLKRQGDGEATPGLRAGRFHEKFCSALPGLLHKFRAIGAVFPVVLPLVSPFPTHHHGFHRPICGQPLKADVNVLHIAGARFAPWAHQVILILPKPPGGHALLGSFQRRSSHTRGQDDSEHGHVTAKQRVRNHQAISVEVHKPCASGSGL